MLDMLPNLNISIYVHTYNTYIGVSVTMAGQTPALQQNWQSTEKSQIFKEKHNI